MKGFTFIEVVVTLMLFSFMLLLLLQGQLVQTKLERAVEASAKDWLKQSQERL